MNRPTRSVHHTRFFLLPLCLSISSLMAACSQIPRTPFAQYTQAFDQTHEAAVELLRDVALVWEESAPDEIDDDAADWRAFDPAAEAATAPADEALLVRHELWRALEHYHRALAALATDAPRATIETEASQLADHLRSISWSRWAGHIERLGNLPPLAGEIIDLTARHLRARRFDRAVRESAPLIRAISETLEVESRDYYALYLAAYNTRRQARLETLVFDLLPPVRTAAAGFPHAVTRDRVQRVNAALRDVMGYQEHELIELSPAASGEPSAREHEPTPDEGMVASLAVQILTITEEQRNDDQQLRARQEALTAYVDLLRGLRHHGDALLAALDEPSAQRPTVDELLINALVLHHRIAAAQRRR